MRVIIFIVVFVLLYNYFCSTTALKGTWQSTPEFSAESGTKVFLDIQDRFKTDCRLVLIHNESGVVRDGTIYFIGLNPFSLIWFKSKGIAFTSGFEDIWPKKIYYEFDALQNSLKIYDKEVYAVLQKT